MNEESQNKMDLSSKIALATIIFWYVVLPASIVFFGMLL